MELSFRLEAIAGCIKPGLVIADIGTDHGYLPIELIRRGIIPKAVACDVRTGPLERARQHIREACLTRCVETRLSNGFENIAEGEANGCVIAGMGGMLVKEILEAESLREKNVLRGMQQLVLQPQSDWEAVRRALHRLSFKIVDEIMLIDRDKYYWILVCEQGKQVYEEDWQYKYGQVLPKKKDPVLHGYLMHKYNKNAVLMNSLKQGEGEMVLLRQTELHAEQRLLEEVLALWN